VLASVTVPCTSLHVLGGFTVIVIVTGWIGVTVTGYKTGDIAVQANSPLTKPTAK
jgi:hypothetical protein